MRVRMVSPNGGATVEVDLTDVDYLESIGWRREGDEPTHEPEEME